MSTKRNLFLIIIASVESSTGLGLLFFPSLPISFLLGLTNSNLDTLFVCRITGAALLAIGVTSWLARTSEPNPALVGLLTGIWIYNSAATALLVYAGVMLDMTGILLWPTVALHGALVVWGTMLLRGISNDVPSIILK